MTFFLSSDPITPRSKSLALFKFSSILLLRDCYPPPCRLDRSKGVIFKLILLYLNAILDFDTSCDPILELNFVPQSEEFNLIYSNSQLSRYSNNH